MKETPGNHRAKTKDNTTLRITCPPSPSFARFCESRISSTNQYNDYVCKDVILSILINCFIPVRMMYYSVSNTGILGIRSECSYNQESNLKTFTSSDALPLSYRRLERAKAIKLGSCLFQLAQENMCNQSIYINIRPKRPQKSSSSTGMDCHRL